VVGNITKKTTIYLKRKFKKKIINIKLPYAPISVLKKQKIILPKNSLTFITLPTPKQEQLAYSLAKNNKNYKVICIGASLAIASGEERKVPNFLSNYEFIWRLRTDTWRRIKRLLESLYFYTKGSIIQKKYDKIYFREIE
jgi:UDP-N-acetyl-D-mannosaminuronic acid transferase (WecB/TagA/CpsF family)